jgi:hypothetical protein
MCGQPSDAVDAQDAAQALNAALDVAQAVAEDPRLVTRMTTDPDKRALLHAMSPYLLPLVERDRRLLARHSYRESPRGRICPACRTPYPCAPVVRAAARWAAFIPDSDE